MMRQGKRHYAYKDSVPTLAWWVKLRERALSSPIMVPWDMNGYNHCLTRQLIALYVPLVHLSCSLLPFL